MADIKETITAYLYSLDEYRAGNGKGKRFDPIQKKKRQDALDRAESALRDLEVCAACNELIAEMVTDKPQLWDKEWIHISGPLTGHTICAVSTVCATVAQPRAKEADRA